MIELRKLTKSYLLNNGERRYIFRGLDFIFPEGANIGLIGRNGAGKSTLLRLIGGIDIPDSGQVISDQRFSWPVGLSGGFHGLLTGRESVKFVCRIYGADGTAMREKIGFVQEFAELGEYFDQPINAYSSGMRSRLAFGMSMAFDFDYYLIDEVMAVGDAQFRMKSRTLLQDRLGQSHVIMVSHNMEDINRLCNVVVLVQDGNAVLYENVREGIRAYQETGGKVMRPKKRPGDGVAKKPGQGGGLSTRKPPGQGGNGNGAGKAAGNGKAAALGRNGAAARQRPSMAKGGQGMPQAKQTQSTSGSELGCPSLEAKEQRNDRTTE